jgi:GntR family transcriptional regulator
MATEEKVYELTSRLDTGSRVPLYEQLATAIHQGILNRVLAPGTVLPPEPEFAAHLGVSRQTVNQALTLLARRGLVTRRRGVGTFVAQPYIEQPLNQVYTFFRSLTAQGRRPSAEILGHRVTVDERASPLLGGQPNSLLIEIQRLDFVDGDPFAVDTIYLPRNYGQAIPVERLAREPLYDLLFEFCGIRVTSAEEVLQLMNVEEPEATLLDLPAGQAVFLVERLVYLDATPIELRRTLLRGDRYRFRVELQASDLVDPGR